MAANRFDRSEFSHAYATAVAWANVAHENDERDDSLAYDDLPVAILEILEEDAEAFLTPQVQRLIQGAIRRGGYSWSQAGHDFALTRNGHGAGFWDRGLGLVGDALTSIAKPYGERNLYVSTDGEVSTD